MKLPDRMRVQARRGATLKRDQVVRLSYEKETSYPLEERPVDRYPKGAQVVSSSSETEKGCPPEERPVDRYPSKRGGQVVNLSSKKEAGTQSCYQ